MDNAPSNAAAAQPKGLKEFAIIAMEIDKCGLTKAGSRPALP
jgi:hypothetical protein